MNEINHNSLSNGRAVIYTIVTLAVVMAARVNAAEVTQSEVTHDNGRFVVHSSILIRLPASRVREILTNHENLPRINPSIKHASLLTPSHNGDTRMRLESRVCSLFVCVNYQWVQTVTTDSSGDILTYFDPSMSDFREGWVRYRITADGKNTRLTTQAVLVPDFWFPPVIGSVFIKKKLSAEAFNTASGIESITANKTRVAYAGS